MASRLGWSVNDPGLLVQAFAHRSWCAEHPGHKPNERLEFLGDAVLGLIVTDFLFQSYPDLAEGELAKIRASVVNASSLAAVARELDLGPALLLGKGEDVSGGRSKLSILADVTEALIGAIYLDAGYDVAREIVLGLMVERVAEAASGPGGQDYKTRLQELCAQNFDELPVYSISGSGPDHAKVFEAEVFIGGQKRGAGEGRSKKQAEQAAARSAWQVMKALAELGAAAEKKPGASAATGPSVGASGDGDRPLGDDSAGAA
ncbi:MAG: ribonuclease III [Acidimicrobiales bacterium]